MLLLAQDQFAEAEALLRESLAMNRASLPPAHPRIANGLGNISAVLLRQGAPPRPSRCGEALELLRQSFPAGHSEIAKLQGGLAAVLHAKGDFSDAESLFSEALATSAAALGPDHPDVGNARMGLGRTLAALDRPAEAEAALLEAYRVLAPASASYDKSREKNVDALAVLYENWHQSEPGKGYDAKAQQWKGRRAAGRPPGTQPAATQPAATQPAE